MAALASARDTKQWGVDKVLFNQLDGKQLTNTKIYKGAIVVRDLAGFNKPGVTGQGLIACGVGDLSGPDVSDSTGVTSGLTTPRIGQGAFLFANSSSGDAIAQADVGRRCYIVDDQTVAKTSGSGTRSVAGLVIAVEAAGVWVLIAEQLAVAERQRDDEEEPAAIAAAGAVPLARRVLASITGTTAYTLANGLWVGQKVWVGFLTGASTPAGTITPATARGFTAVSAIGAAGDFVEFMWTATGWIILGHGGVTVT